MQLEADEKFWLQRGVVAAILGIAGNTLDNWPLPTRKKGRVKLYDIRVVVKFFVQHQIEKAAPKPEPKDLPSSGVGAISIHKARLAKENADAKALENKVKRGELLPRAAVLDQWQNDYSVLKSQLLALPTKLVQGGVQQLPAHEFEDYVRGLIYECLIELSETGLPVDQYGNNETIGDGSGDVEAAAAADSQ